MEKEEFVDYIKDNFDDWTLGCPTKLRNKFKNLFIRSVENFKKIKCKDCHTDVFCPLVVLNHLKFIDFRLYGIVVLFIRKISRAVSMVADASLVESIISCINTKNLTGGVLSAIKALLGKAPTSAIKETTPTADDAEETVKLIIPTVLLVLLSCRSINTFKYRKFEFKYVMPITEKPVREEKEEFTFRDPNFFFRSVDKPPNMSIRY